MKKKNRFILFSCFLLLVACSKSRPVYIGAEYVGKKYTADPLGEEKFPDLDPLIRFDAFDCMTFVETSLAGGDLDKLTKIRYKNGDIDFLNRNHFTETDWLENNKDIIENGSQYKALVYNKKTKKLVKTFDNVVTNWQGMMGWNGMVVAADYTFVTADYKQYVVKAKTYRVEYEIDERFADNNSPNPLVKTEYPDIFVIKPYLGSKGTIESGKKYKVIIYKKGSDDIVKIFDDVVSSWQGMTGWSGAVEANDFTFVTANYKQYIVKLKKYDVEVED